MFVDTIDGVGELKFLQFPADVFAVCAKIARITGCYLEHSRENKRHLKNVSTARDDGKDWVLSLARGGRGGGIPAGVKDSWRRVCIFLRKYSGSKDPLVVDKSISADILYLIAACDSACEGLGIPDGESPGIFGLASEAVLAESGTLCQILGARFGRVLPKRHTPKVGINLRNLTRHICYCDESEVSVNWTTESFSSLAYGRSYNVLVIPWPFHLHPTALVPSERRSSDRAVGYFEYSPVSAKGDVDLIFGIVEKTLDLGHRVDLVVLPECALAARLWADVSERLNEIGVSVLSGVYGKKSRSKEFYNTVRFRAGYPWSEDVVQHKHHRWKLDRAQIVNYGLGGTLSCQKEWWENIFIPKRELSFFALDKDLVVCPLVCEDLARQDPVADVVRSVGPNLVIALLMDGPQLPSRWSARYASVLADDPGSSVLTVSSLGMVRLSTPPPGVARKNVVASWKQAGGDFVEMALEGEATAVLMNLQFDPDYEQTVDGFKDGSYSSIPVLTGVHYV